MVVLRICSLLRGRRNRYGDFNLLRMVLDDLLAVKQCQSGSRYQSLFVRNYRYDCVFVT